MDPIAPGLRRYPQQGMSPPQHVVRGPTSEAIEELLDEALARRPTQEVVVRLGMHQADNADAIQAVAMVIGAFAPRIATIKLDAFHDPVIAWGAPAHGLTAVEIEQQLRFAWGEGK